MQAGIIKIKRALISVSDKTGLAELAKKLHENGVSIISSGGTGKFLTEQGIPVTPIEKITRTPECFGGRVKTLSYQVAGALLFRRDNPDDVSQATQLGIEPIDLLVCNLYPFEAVAKTNPEWAELIENIDIGGPTLIRAAAKNYASVVVVTNPEQYNMVELEMGPETRSLLAMEAFRHTARYDSLIAAKLEEKLGAEERTIVLSPKGAQKLRYGENPHQKSWVYMDPFHPGLASSVPLQGKELSYNNLLDADAAWRSCGDISVSGNKHYTAAVSIIKHLTPCGVALSDTPLEALKLAWAGDTVSAFGGILCFNKEVDKTVAKWLNDKFVEVILAPSFAADALEVFAAKKNLRLIALPAYDGTYRPPMIKSISGGFVVQQEDTGYDSELRQMTSKQFPPDKKDIAHFGVMACKHLKSNAIGLFVAQKNGLNMIGAGMGNPNRLISVRQAIEKAHENGYKDLSQAVLVSDAFFPFPDNIDLAKQAGIKAIVQPGGSIKDKDVIAAANDAGIAMVFTGRRHFRH